MSRVYKIKEIIGQGSFGAVIRCESSSGESFVCKNFQRYGDKPPYSAKIFSTEGNRLGPDGYKEQYMQEVSIYTYLSNRIPGICRSVDTGNGHLVMEAHLDGDMVSNSPFFNRKERDLRTFSHRLYKLFQTVRLLHESHIAHLDIKPNNILMSSKGDYILCDVGNCAFIRHSVYDSCSFKGDHIPNMGLMPRLDRNITSEFCPPEGLKSTFVDPYTNKQRYRPRKEADLQHIWYPADIWSLACTIYTMLTGDYFTNYTSEESNNVLVHDLSYISNAMSQEMKHKSFDVYIPANRDKGSRIKTFGCPITLLERVKRLTGNIYGKGSDIILEKLVDLMIFMLDPDPRTRPTALECLGHPIFEEFWINDNKAYTAIKPILVPKNISKNIHGVSHKSVLKLRNSMMRYLNKMYEKGKTGTDSASLAVTIIDRVLANTNAYNKLFAGKSNYDISQSGTMVVRACVAISNTVYYLRYFNPDANGRIDEGKYLLYNYICYIYLVVLEKNVYAISV